MTARVQLQKKCVVLSVNGHDAMTKLLALKTASRKGEEEVIHGASLKTQAFSSVRLPTYGMSYPQTLLESSPFGLEVPDVIHNEVSSRDQPFKERADIERFTECICRHHYPSLITETERGSETVNTNSIYKGLIARVGFIIYNHRDSFKSHSLERQFSVPLSTVNRNKMISIQS
jgi:hypothetical protein